MEKKLLNRDISWLKFDQRVNDEAFKKNHTLAEQVMFLGITFSNLDEFLMVRYPAAVEDEPEEVVDELTEKIGKHYKTFIDRFREFNKEHKIVRRVKDLSKDSQKWLADYFKKSVFPALLPITVDSARRANIHAGLYVMVITELDGNRVVGYIEIPTQLGRFVQIPGKSYVIMLEDLVQENLKQIIHGSKILNSCAFSILRSAEVYDQSDHYADPYDLIKQVLKQREESWVTCLEIGTDKKECIRTIRQFLPMSPNTIILTTDRIKLSDLKHIPASIYKDSERSRKNPIYNTFPEGSVFDYIKKEDRLCFHPFESYDGSMVRFLEEAAVDLDVVSIRICLYRVSDRSRIIDALLRAADSGKLVTVLIELKARFDEKHNMQIAQILRKGGIRIIYTKPNIKTHAKVCLVTRKEKKGLRVYSHIGTGNYSESNSRQYTDYSYFSADQELGTDLTQFFNILTSSQGDFKSRKILYAPYNLKSEIVDNINQQIKLAKKKETAKIVIKCNALTDIGVAQKLIEAAAAGVKVILIIRSACIIQPQKNIEIYSIVGTYLEHSRVYVFGSGKKKKVYIGSSDMMTRNLSRRNELLILVENKEIKGRILNHMAMYLKDTVNRRRILPNYKYEDIKPEKGKKGFDCQKAFLKEAQELEV